MSRLFAVGLWLLATIVSTTIVWTATSTVAADVTDRPAPVVPHRDVVSELATAPSTTSTTTTTRPSSTSTTRARTTVTRNPPATTPAPPTTQPAAPSTTVAAAPPVITPSTTQAPSRPTATYSTAGGVVRVACDGFLIQLLSATPADGWSALVASRGPINVEVHFLRFGQDIPVKVVCFGQPFRYFGDIPVRP